VIAGFLDTNILLYSISTVPAEAEKRAIAQGLIDQDGWGLSVQVLQEFYVQATRAGRADALPHDLAAEFIRVWMRFTVQDMTSSVMLNALDIRARCGFSYWDSAIVAAAAALGARRLYSEDLQHGRIVDGVEIVDPFRKA